MVHCSITLNTRCSFFTLDALGTKTPAQTCKVDTKACLGTPMVHGNHFEACLHFCQTTLTFTKHKTRESLKIFTALDHTWPHLSKTLHDTLIKVGAGQIMVSPDTTLDQIFQPFSKIPCPHLSTLIKVAWTSHRGVGRFHYEGLALCPSPPINTLAM